MNIKLFSPAKLVADHLFGENHSEKHRVRIGFVFMVIGISIVKGGSIIPIEALHVFTDFIGCTIHAAGCEPVLGAIRGIETKPKDEIKAKTTCEPCL